MKLILHPIDRHPVMTCSFRHPVHLIECGEVNPLMLNPYAGGGLFGQYKMMQKKGKVTETLAYGYSYESTQRELSNEYQLDRV